MYIHCMGKIVSIICVMWLFFSQIHNCPASYEIKSRVQPSSVEIKYSVTALDEEKGLWIQGTSTEREWSVHMQEKRDRNKRSLLNECG